MKTLMQYVSRPIDDNVIEMLKHSNYIENERNPQAHKDASDAWSYAVKNNKCITTKFVLKIHKLLCKNIAPAIAGKFRDCDVYIGGQRKIFVSVALIEDDVKQWIKRWDGLSKKLTTDLNDLEGIAKKAHLEFENIHPFVDGNGRTGRILYNLHRIKLGLPIHIIHEGFEQWEYYKWFRPDINNPFD